jgi:hypothetical protein
MSRSILLRRLQALTFGGLLALGATAEDARPDAQGYIRNWVMLAPLVLPDGGIAADLLLRDQIPNESALQPKDGDVISLRGRQLTWKGITASTNVVDLNALLKSQNDQCVGYLVTYIEADQEIPNVMMSVASNDQGRIYFNGVDIYAFTEARSLMLDGDKGKVTLKKGTNVIIFKIINEQNSWQGAMRLTDLSGVPLKNVKIKTAP